MAFYAFQRLHHLDTGMRCPVCGDAPSIVICDGCVLAFEKRRLTGQCRPPTMPDGQSVVKGAVQAISMATLSDTSLSATRKQAATFRDALSEWATKAKRRIINLEGIADELDLVAEKSDLGKALRTLIEAVAPLDPFDDGARREMHAQLLQEVSV
jgi:hypothetical protein